MDHRQARKTGWTIIGCGCVFIILTKLWVGLAMAPLGLLLMLIFGFWFVTEVSCQIVYGDIDRVFHIEENIRKMKDAELEAALKEDYADDDTPEE